MLIVACSAPNGTLEHAPLTSLPIHMGTDRDRITAFWGADDEYLVCVQGDANAAWYRIEAEPMLPVSDEVTRAEIGALMADVHPLGAGRVAFPVGSSGRHVFRVWRGKKGGTPTARTKILGVRAGRSHRRQA